MTIAGRSRSSGTWALWLLLLFALGLNLRGSMGAIPLLTPHLMEELDLTAAQVGLVTSLSMAMLGLGAPIGSLLAVRWSAWAMPASLAVLSIGHIARVAIETPTGLYATSVLTGIGMGSATALVPGLIRHKLPGIRGTATGLYSVSLALGVALAAVLAVPVTDLQDWRMALAVWAVPSVTVFAAFTVMAIRGADHPEPNTSSSRASAPSILTSPAAWLLSTITALTFVLGFSGMAWIAPAAQHHGASPAQAASIMVVFQLVQLLSMLSLPTLTDRFQGRRTLMLSTTAAMAIGIVLLTLWPSNVALMAAAFYGFGAGGTSSLSLVLVQDQATTRQHANRLSAMSMAIGAIGGGTGPLLVGGLRDLTGGFTTSFISLFAATVLLAVAIVAMKPGQDFKEVGEVTQPPPN